MFEIIIIIIIIAILYFFYVHREKQIKENWTTYRRGPYGTASTGSTPLRFYRRRLFREPYGYPYFFFTTYPFRGLTYSVPS